MKSRDLIDFTRDARERTLALFADLTDEQMLGPELRIVNPPLWEIGHVGWFAEHWVLQHVRNQPPIREDADSLYDSMAVAHDTRWNLPLPSRQETIDYLLAVRDQIAGGHRLAEPSAEELYYNLLSIYHEDMHTEAFTYTRQTHGYRAPRFPSQTEVEPAAGCGPFAGDVEIRGGSFELGAQRDRLFVFDNEKWAHPIEVPQFRIARASVTQAEFAHFVDDGGYNRREYWNEDGWRWREENQAKHPVYWRKREGAWERRDFDRWVPLEPHKPVLHVSWYEADGYARWAGRRLPTEAEWEMAASLDPASGGKRLYPWGDDPPSPQTANLDWQRMGAIDVGALPAGDSPNGCRQMVGNVWEWTRTPFHPYPEFSADPYKDYSEPWFYSHMVLRGGCWATRSRLINNTYRNFYRPERRDVWAGIRTCAQ